jgi:hypothetical protein
MNAPPRTVFARVEAGVLALWLGATLFFTAAVAPAAFDVLQNPSLAGVLVGRLLPSIFLSGLAIGVGIVAWEATSRRPGRAWRMAAGGTMLVACAVAHFAIGRRIDRLRDSVPGLSARAQDDPGRAAFRRLHGLSVAALGTAMVAAAAGAVAASTRG